MAGVLAAPHGGGMVGGGGVSTNGLAAASGARGAGVWRLSVSVAVAFPGGWEPSALLASGDDTVAASEAAVSRAAGGSGWWVSVPSLVFVVFPSVVVGAGGTGDVDAVHR